MKLYKVIRKEFSGYGCAGHDVTHLVYAHTVLEASMLIPKKDEDLWGDEEYTEEFEMPIVGRKRNGFIVF